MKLLFILKKLSNGGVTQTLTTRVNYLSNNTDFEIHILTEYPNDQELLARINPKGNIHTLDLEKNTNKKRLPILGYFELLNEVKSKYQEFIDQLQPDIISSFNFGYNKEIIPFIKSPAKKIVELRGSYSSRNKLKNFDLKYSLINIFRKNHISLQNSYDYAVTISKQDALDRKYLKNNIRTIYNTYKKRKIVNEFSRRDNIIIAAGTLTHNKNFRDLIKAAHFLKRRLAKWEIHIYGEGVQKEELQNLITKYNLGSIVFLKGYSRNLSDSYNNSKLLISTSLSEGFGNTILEALAHKTPVISYDCKCGPKEIILDNVNGYIIDFNYKILASKILELVQNEDLLNKFSQNTVLSLEKFEYEKIMNEWVEFYNSITEEGN